MRTVSIRDILAHNIKEYRRKIGLTQEKLAEKAGISANYLSMVEISRKFPTPEMLDRLAHALNVHTFQLFDPSATPEGALLNLEQSIVAKVDTVLRSVIKQEITSEISNTVNKAVKQALSEAMPPAKKTAKKKKHCQ